LEADEGLRSESREKEIGFRNWRPAKHILPASAGVFVAVLVCAGFASQTHLALVLGSFGSSCVILFGLPFSEFSQPKNFVGGHFFSSLLGLACYHFIGTEWWAMGLAAGLATAVMMMTGTLHPPAGSNPLIIYQLKADWDFLWFPTLAGALLVQTIVIVYNRSLRKLNYPKVWF
jgi:CBS-domain-containing membrane protein